MNDQFAQIRDHFLAALEHDGLESQLQYIEQSCAETPELCERLEEMVRAHHQSGGFLASKIASTIDQPVAESLGAIIGPYKLLQQIGEGGMGVVYLAEQTEPVKRQVAVKLIKPGMDSRQVIGRFEAERQALAIMDHPHIAKVLDAGMTDSGRPYFVMELVKGVPITEYCDAHHLSVSQRLELFIAVCQAVQHAHQKGIIHRDLKPNNVLVTEYDDQPVPKVIDFGVAKATAQRLTEGSFFTEFGQVIGTMAYMSPEQARVNQVDVDTRSDIYSLGVLLYEILTGSTPFEGKRLHEAAFVEMLRIIREEEPPKPSTRLSSSESLPSIAANRSLEPKMLTGLVSGELDWIVMKCLEKEREKRYSTAAQLADEFRRFLAGEPIQARPVTIKHRMWRWYCRNVPLVAGAYTVFTFLIPAVIHVALFSIIQFLVSGPDASELLSAFGVMAMTLLICILGMEMGIAAFRGRRRGLWMSLVVFVLFSVAQSWSLYWSIVISREISTDPVYSSTALSPGSAEGRKAYIRNCVIAFNVSGLVWSFIGLVLNVHAVSRPATDQTLHPRRR